MPHEILNVDIEALAPGEMKAVQHAGFSILVCNVDGEFHALENECSHAAVPLDEGTLRGCELECAFHGALFDVRSGKRWQCPRRLRCEFFRWNEEVVFCRFGSNAFRAHLDVRPGLRLNPEITLSVTFRRCPRKCGRQRPVRAGARRRCRHRSRECEIPVRLFLRRESKRTHCEGSGQIANPRTGYAHAYSERGRRGRRRLSAAPSGRWTS